MKGTELYVFQNSNAMTVGGDGELDGFRSQVGHYCLEVGMHAVLTGPKIHRANGQAFHDCLDLIHGETIGTSWIAVAESAGEITLVGESESQRDTSVGLNDHSSGQRRLGCDVVHAPSVITGPIRSVQGNVCIEPLRQTPVAFPACALARKSARSYHFWKSESASNPRLRVRQVLQQLRMKLLLKTNVGCLS